MQRRIFLAGIGLVLGACASGPKYQVLPPPAPGRAWIVVYRVFTLPSAAYGTSLWLDGRQFGEVRVSQFTRVSVPAGPHKLHYNNEKSTAANTVEFEAKAGEQYFFRYSVGVGSITPTGPGYLVINQGNLRLVAVGSAPRELEEYSLVSPIADVIE